MLYVYYLDDVYGYKMEVRSNVPLKDFEAQAYAERGYDKYGKICEVVEVNIVDDEEGYWAEIEYITRPQNFERIRRITKPRQLRSRTE